MSRFGLYTIFISSDGRRARTVMEGRKPRLRTEICRPVVVLARHPNTSTPSTLKFHIFKRLRRAIVAGQYRPGERLNESKIARDFCVSRILVREALMQLQQTGLVMNHERRGMFCIITVHCWMSLLGTPRWRGRPLSSSICARPTTSPSAYRATAPHRFLRVKAPRGDAGGASARYET